MITSFAYSMELPNGTAIGAPGYSSFTFNELKNGIDALAASQTEGIKSGNGKHYFQCTLNIQKLSDLHKKYRQKADIKIEVRRDLDGNCPTVFVSMQEQYVPDFCKDPLILKYVQIEDEMAIS
jgi:hypothetical protein